MSVLLKLSKSSKKRFENNSVVITQKTSKGILFFIQSNISKIDRLRGERKEMVKLINTSTSSVRVAKPSTGSGLESPNSTHNAVAELNVAVLDPIVEILPPRTVVIELRRTPIEVISKTANGNSVYIQLV